MYQNTTQFKLSIEIEELRKKINDEFQQCHHLSSPKIINLSQRLDQKILKVQELKSVSSK